MEGPSQHSIIATEVTKDGALVNATLDVHDPLGDDPSFGAPDDAPGDAQVDANPLVHVVGRHDVHGVHDAGLNQSVADVEVEHHCRDMRGDLPDQVVGIHGRFRGGNEQTRLGVAVGLGVQDPY